MRNTKQNFKYAILRPWLLLSFVPPWGTICLFVCLRIFDLIFKVFTRVKNTHKQTYWYGYKKINDKNLTDQLNCSYFTLFYRNQSWIVKKFAISKAVSLRLAEFRLFLWNRQEIDKKLRNCKEGWLVWNLVRFELIFNKLIDVNKWKI